MSEIATRYATVSKRIIEAAARAGRNPNEITLVAVTKTWPADVIKEAFGCGMRHFGENRAEELSHKQPLLAAELGPGITWHAIGTLQSRKAKAIANHADVFHALDRQRIGERLSRQLQENGRQLPCFLEVNVSGEGSKSGYLCENWENDATQLEGVRTMAQELDKLAGLHLIGLMTMAPWGVAPEQIRGVFKRTRQLADRLNDELKRPAPLQLSMGMTDDFEIAIEEGATHVRVGRAIFGSRH